MQRISFLKLMELKKLQLLMQSMVASNLLSNPRYTMKRVKRSHWSQLVPVPALDQTQQRWTTLIKRNEAHWLASKCRALKDSLMIFTVLLVACITQKIMYLVGLWTHQLWRPLWKILEVWRKSWNQKTCFLNLSQMLFATAEGKKRLLGNKDYLFGTPNHLPLFHG